MLISPGLGDNVSSRAKPQFSALRKRSYRWLFSGCPNATTGCQDDPWEKGPQETAQATFPRLGCSLRGSTVTRSCVISLFDLWHSSRNSSCCLSHPFLTPNSSWGFTFLTSSLQAWAIFPKSSFASRVSQPSQGCHQPNTHKPFLPITEQQTLGSPIQGHASKSPWCPPEIILRAWIPPPCLFMRLKRGWNPTPTILWFCLETPVVQRWLPQFIANSHHVTYWLVAWRSSVAAY